MIIYKITLSVDYNYWLKRLNTQLIEPTNHNSIKAPKVVEPSNRKTLSLSFGDFFNKHPIVPSLPGNLENIKKGENNGGKFNLQCFLPSIGISPAALLAEMGF